MKLELSAQQLNRELERLVPITEKNKTNPTLEYAFLEPVDSSSIRLTTTDLRETLECTIENVLMENATRLCLPARRLHQLTKLMEPMEKITFKTDANGFVRVSQKKTNYRLASISPSVFPETARNFSGSVPVPAASLRQMIRLAAAFVGEDDSRYAYSGACLEADGTRLKLTTTDGQRLGYAEMPLAAYDPFRVLIPKKGLLQIAALLSGDSPEAEISFAKDASGEISKVRFRSGTRHLSINLTTGTFPDCSQVLKVIDQNPFAVTLPRSELANSLARIRSVLDDAEPFVRLDFGLRAIRVSSAFKDVGEGLEEVAATHTADTPSEVVSVGVNLNFITEFMRAAADITPKTDARVFIRYKDSASFMEFGIDGTSSGQKFRYAVAPSRLKENG